MVTGVARVQVFGAQKYAVRVEGDPEKLAAHQMDLGDVRTALSSGSLTLPAGSLYGNTKAYTVQSNSQLTSAAQFRQLIVTYRNGNPVRLGEVAKVLDSVSDDKSVFWLNGNRAIILAVDKQPGVNTIAVADSVKALIPAIRQSIPASIKINAAFDASQDIRHSVEDVKVTLALAIVLVVGVIFVFLRNVSATLIPSLAVPLSLLGTFGVMKLLGYSIDTFSLMAMTLSVGFVVDDAIVMLENIVRHLEMGKPRRQASLEGAREVGFTIVSMTVSLVAVFIPVIFMGGIIGRLLREFSITIAVAVLISGFISLTLTPMLCSRFLRHEPERKNIVFRYSEKFFTGLNNLYRNTLHSVLRHRRITLAGSILLTIATLYMFVIMPKGFLPTVDQGFIFGGSEAAQDTSFDEMVRLQKQVTNIMVHNPYVEFTGSGTGGGTGQNGGFIFAKFKSGPRPSATTLIGQLEQQFAKIPGIMVYLRVPPLLTLGQGEGRSEYSVALQGPDVDELYKWAPKLEAKLRTLPELKDIYSDLRLASPRLEVHIDRNRALAVGVTPDQIANTLYSAYGARKVSTIIAASDQYDVLLQVLPEYQKDPNALSKLYIRSSAGKMVPLSAVTEVSQTVAPLSVNHIGQLPAVNFQFNVKPGVSLDVATKVVSDAAHQIGLPENMTFTYQGTAAAFQSALGGLAILLVIALFVIYLVLGILYESFIHPITILSGLPAAGMGALITLWIFGETLNLYSFVGIILLIGIVKKNAIMMIDFALASQRKGKSPEESIIEGCLQRFRPIMMTTMAALLGTLPVAIGAGAGGEARRPLGLAVVGGLIVSQLLTLYITPVIYLYLDRFTHWRIRKPKAQTVATWPTEETLVKS